MNKKYHFEIEQILELADLYELGVPLRTIAKIHGMNSATLWHRLKKYEEQELFQFRSRSETVLMTLSKSRTSPKGEKTKRVKDWFKNFGREGILDILTVFLLVEASADYKYGMIRLTNSDETLLQIFTDILLLLNLEPRQTIDSRNNLRVVFSRNSRTRKVLDEIYVRTPTTKHQPRRGTENWEMYLKTTQPNLLWLYGRSRKLIELCFRIAMSCDGSVFRSRGIKHLPDRPQLTLVCFHPLLLLQWKEIASLIGLNMNISGKRIRSRSIETSRKFLKMGAFLEGVRISSKGSKQFRGIEKNTRLNDLLNTYDLR